MVGNSPMIPPRHHFVVDSGYLDELYAIDNYSNESSRQIVHDKFNKCIDSGDILYVPYPVLFEVARHIVEIKSSSRRTKLAKHLYSSVVSSCRDRQPWIIPGAHDHDVATTLAKTLLGCCHEFSSTFAASGETLTDVAVILEAQALKTRFAKAKDRRHLIHIWTRDRAVKAHEPDTEEDPFT